MMKKYILFSLLLSAVPCIYSRIKEIPPPDEEQVRISYLTPVYVEKLLNEHGSGYVVIAIDDVVRDEDKMGNIEDNVTMLHLIARTPVKNGQGRKKILQLARQVVLERPELVNAQQNEGFTPLHNAAYRGYHKMVEMFLNSGADRSIRDNFKYQTAAEWAKQAGRTKTARLLQTYQGPALERPKLKGTVAKSQAFKRAIPKPQERMRRMGLPPFVGSWSK